MTEDSTNITLSPCYDLLSTHLLIPTDREEVALTLNGKKQNIRRKDFIELGKNLNIPDKVIQNTIESMYSYIPQWNSMIHKSFLNNELKKQFNELIKERIQILER